MTSIKKKKNEHDKEIIKCPSCGKCVPKLSYCEKCGASFKSKHRISTKSVLIFVLIVAGLGIGMLSYGFFRGNYITPIGSVTTGMEGDTIRVKGYVTYIEFWEEYERTTFNITALNGEAEIQVSGWSEFTSDIKNKGYPELGDIAIVEGSVEVYQEKVSIEVTDADSFSISHKSPKQMNVGDITAEQHYKKVNITGNLIDTIYSSYSYDVLKLEGDNSSTRGVKIVSDQIAFTGENAIVPEVGDRVRIIGMVELYYSTPQIIPSTMTNKSIKILS